MGRTGRRLAKERRLRNDHAPISVKHEDQLARRRSDYAHKQEEQWRRQGANGFVSFMWAMGVLFAMFLFAVIFGE